MVPSTVWIVDWRQALRRKVNPPSCYCPVCSVCSRPRLRRQGQSEERGECADGLVEPHWISAWQRAAAAGECERDRARSPLKHEETSPLNADPVAAFAMVVRLSWHLILAPQSRRCVFRCPPICHSSHKTKETDH